MTGIGFLRRTKVLLVAAGLALAAAGPAAAQEIVRITIQPATVDLATDEVVLLSAQATFTDGSVANVSELVDWRSSNTGVTRVSNARGSKGKVTGKSPGQSTISVQDPVSGVTSGQSGGGAVIHVLGRLKSLRVTPADRRIDVGATRSMVALGTFSDGSEHDLSEQVSWESSNANVVRVSNEPGRRGRATGLSPGTAKISVRSSSGITSTATGGDATVRVPSALVSIQVLPPAPRVPAGLTLELNAQGTFSDGTTDDISNQVTWTSSAAAVASVSDAEDTKGEVTALQPGTALVSVVDPTTGISSSPTGGDAVITVAGTLVSIAIDPNVDAIPTGLTRSFAVQGRLDDGSKFSMSRRDLQWTSSNPGVASVSNDRQTAGVVTGVAKGVARISAFHPPTGIHADQDSVITVLGRMVGIAVRPKTRDLFTGQTNRFSAVALLDDGSEARLSRDIEFFTSNGAIVGINNQAGHRGDATGIGRGRASISVVHRPSGMNSSNFGTDATAVVRGRVEQVRVDPREAFYWIGTQPKLRCRATFDDGSSANIGSDVVWTSSDTSIAEIGNVSPNKGVLMPKTVGKITVSAVEPVSGLNTTAQNGDGTVTIVDGLQKLRVRDSNDKLRTGDVLNLRALGTFPDPVPAAGTSGLIEIELTDFVELTSSDPGVVRVENGRLLAVGLGQATVSARDPRTGILSSQSGGDAVFKVIAALTDIRLKPGRVTVHLGSARRLGFVAMGLYTDRARIELTDKVIFTTADPSIAQVSNEADRHGLVVPVKAGVTTTTATDPVTGVQSKRPRRIVVRTARGGRSQ